MAKAFSSATTISFSLSISLFEFKPLLLKKALIVFQNFLLSVNSFIYQFLKVVFLGIAKKIYTEVPLFFAVVLIFLSSCFMENIFQS